MAQPASSAQLAPNLTISIPLVNRVRLDAYPLMVELAKIVVLGSSQIKTPTAARTAPQAHLALVCSVSHVEQVSNPARTAQAASLVATLGIVFSPQPLVLHVSSAPR
eukprot:SAG31_NODE_724_length_12555_cov_11.624277_8_plen_107_part_00